MAYELHIERHPLGITLDEWFEVVGKLDGIKLAESRVEAKNPKTGEIIAIQGNPGDVSVLFQTKGFLGLGQKSEWHICIRFVCNKASMNSPAPRGGVSGAGNHTTH